MRQLVGFLRPRHQICRGQTLHTGNFFTYLINQLTTRLQNIIKVKVHMNNNLKNYGFHSLSIFHTLVIFLVAQVG